MEGDHPTAAQIANRYVEPRSQTDLERDILRHMEHHMIRASDGERDACVQIILAGAKDGWTTEMVIDEIRARKSANIAFAPKL